jgi:hypothetical protein
MKAITLWQPWASLLACGAKQYETRSWATNYRGPIAIHTAKKDIYSIIKDLPFNVLEPMYLNLYKEMKIKSQVLKRLEQTQGCIIATAELVNCKCILYKSDLDCIIAAERKFPDCGEFIIPTEQEKMFGDWTPGRYAWEFANMKILKEPIPAKGKQGLWNWEEQ